MDSPYDDHSLPQPTHLSHLSRNLSGLSVNSASPGATQHHPDRPFGLRISTSVSNPGSHNPSPSVAPSRKRSFNSNPPTLPSLSTTVMGAGMVSGSATPLLEEDISGRGMDLDLDYDKYDKYHETKYEKYDPDLPPNSALTSAPPSAIPMSGSGSRGSITPGGTSPIDGGGSGSGGSCEEGNVNSTSGKIGHGSGIGTGMGLMGKPMPTNNFVTKLYQMINDPKSAHFISWTEHGTSFVVSNVGEFSRSILGSHFKHNNFSSFVRQLNMYGFHKINRTPRAQRTSSDAQTWEFSHHKFLRGRPDLLDEIKRKALLEGQGGIGVGPEGVRARVELPGEVAAQLGAMREDSRRLWEAFT
ncbi:HSF-type DNA-binding-domain-containing protein [Rhodocollybia butyracea]|uniref:HSF-type DNA-binding-domain-containing protein n=1 Tax=Rhodocollybia butyracea TaxID=206335 RepID=A0A9P5U619_9AGAR|nr:HSF-type DNA-binding-domain-containing protein [Rhodocollybia butyracea]